VWIAFDFISISVVVQGCEVYSPSIPLVVQFCFSPVWKKFSILFLSSSSSRTSSVDYCVFCASSHVLSWGRLCALDVGTYPPFVRFLGLEIFSSCWIPGRPIYKFARR